MQAATASRRAACGNNDHLSILWREVISLAGGVDRQGVSRYRAPGPVGISNPKGLTLMPAPGGGAGWRRSVTDEFPCTFGSHPCSDRMNRACARRTSLDADGTKTAPDFGRIDEVKRILSSATTPPRPRTFGAPDIDSGCGPSPSAGTKGFSKP